jgi:ketosteroid isomerase-like protein
MSTPLPPLSGPPDQVAIAARVREHFVAAMSDARRDFWRKWEEANSDAWEELMRDDVEQASAFESMLARRDAAWWIARRQKSLAALAREEFGLRTVADDG